jgi:predicted GNAT family N-acyltransferase
VSLEVRLARPGDGPAQRVLRHEVFVVGQGVPAELEQDDRDATADHVVAYRDDRLVGTGRLLTDGGQVATVGRMAVAEAERNAGVGAAMLRLLEQRAVARRCTAVELHAQVHARRFYERAGYTATTDVYLEAGIEHVTMRKPLPVVRPVRDDDGAALIALIGGCWAEYPGVELHVDEEEPWLREPASAYSRWGGRMWVVELDGEVVACCGVKPVAEGVVELKSMYVAARARRRGLARLLEGLVLAEARERGADRVELWSDTRFLDAHTTYTVLGYEQLPGERDLHDRSHSREYPFAKQL